MTTPVKNKNYTAKQVNGTWRIVGENGKPALNIRGMPIDKGGFVDAYETKRHIQRHARFEQVIEKMSEVEQ